MTKQPRVAILMGSDSDLPAFESTRQILREFNVPHEVRVLSAHRTPEAVRRYVTTAASRGIHVLIAGAGGAAHLAGVVAAHTTLPVLGVPMDTRALKGLDSLLSTVQMPQGVPVGTLAIGKAGAANAAMLAVQILALQSATLRRKLAQFKRTQTARVLATDRRLRRVLR